MDNGALHREFAYYRMNQSALVRRYKGKYLVIVGEKVVSDHETDLEAYLSAKASRPVGTFLIQHCLPGKESYTQTFHSRVTVQ